MTTSTPARRPVPGRWDDGLALGWRPEVRLEVSGDRVVFRAPSAAFALRGVGAGVLHAIARLAAEPVPLNQLLHPLTAAERDVLGRVLDRTEHLLARSLLAGDRPLLRLEGTAEPSSPHRPTQVPDGALVRLSAFAMLRSRHGELVLESPLSTTRVVVLDRRVRSLVSDLATPRCPTLLTRSGLAGDEVRAVVGHLVGAGLVEVADPQGAFASDVDPTLRQWDFHDLLMHGRIRSGRYDDPHGAVYAHRGVVDPQPAVREPPAGPVIPLYRPSWSEVADRDPSLTTALEGRRSVRSYGDAPMTARQLGEFLYRVARVRAHYVPQDGSDEAVSRPYPSGGRSYELELWLTVRRCSGLAQGIYYYDPVGHRLVLVNGTAGDREAMLDVAARATGAPGRPDVLVTMTSRFQRVSWKYRSIAYATTLRHTGVLYQTMYLVATAMGLAPCGLGNGDAGLAARVLGLDYLVESSVGDFLLGSRDRHDVMGGPRPAAWHLVNGADWPLRASGLLPRHP